MKEVAGKKEESEDTDQIIKGLCCHSQKIGLYPTDDRKLFKDLRQKRILGRKMI